MADDRTPTTYLAAADPETTTTVVAGIMLMTSHQHAMDIEPDHYLSLVASEDADKARAKATQVIAALELAGYIIALRVPEGDV